MKSTRTREYKQLGNASTATMYSNAARKFLIITIAFGVFIYTINIAARLAWKYTRDCKGRAICHD